MKATGQEVDFVPRENIWMSPHSVLRTLVAGVGVYILFAPLEKPLTFQIFIGLSVAYASYSKKLVFNNVGLFLLLLLLSVPLWNISALEEFSEVFTRTSFLVAFLVGVGLTASHDARMASRSVVFGFLGLLMFSIFLAVADPYVAFGLGSNHPGDFVGHWAHKNLHGFVMGIATLASVSMACERGSTRLGYISLAGLFFVAVVATGSVTATLSTVIVMVGLMGLIFLRWLRIRHLKRITLWVGTILAFGLAILIALAPPFLSLFDRDLSFTGRTTIWRAILEEVPEFPLLGFGWDFWSTDESRVVAVREEIMRVVGMGDGWASAHNAFLEALIVGGFPALVVLCGLVTYSAWSSSRALVNSDDSASTQHAFVFMLASFALVAGTFGSFLFSQEVGWLVLGILAGSVAQKSVEPSKI